MPIRQKPHRLDAWQYRGQITVAFTACERERRPILATEVNLRLIELALDAACRKHTCRVPLFVVMPDHVHVLLTGNEIHSSPLFAMRYFKWRTATDRAAPIAWQEGFYDHIVQAESGWVPQARYLANNPVRKELVGKSEDWPFQGSIGFDHGQVLREIFE